MLDPSPDLLAPLISQGPTVAALLLAGVWIDRRVLPVWERTTETLGRAAEILERACQRFPPEAPP